MSRKISEFFIKKTIKAESSEVEPIVISNSFIDNISVKSEFGEDIPCSDKDLQNLILNNNSEQENQIRINENVKTEAEKQLLVILPEQKNINFQFQSKLKKMSQKLKNSNVKSAIKYSVKSKILKCIKVSTIKSSDVRFVTKSIRKNVNY